MAKRLTKDQREARDKAALWQRVSDIVAGACASRCYDTGESSISPGELSRAIPALRHTFAEHEGGKWTYSHLWEPWNLDEYETIDRIVVLFYNAGIRANGKAVS